MDNNIVPQENAANTQNPENPKTINFAKSLSLNLGFADIKYIQERTGSDVIMPSYEKYRADNPNITEETAQSNYENIRNIYSVYETSNVSKEGSILARSEGFTPTLSNIQRGLPVYDIPDSTIIHDMSSINVAHLSEPLQIQTTQVIADSFGYIFTKDGEMVENNASNRRKLGGSFQLQTNPDPKSNVPYFWKQTSWFDHIQDPETMRSWLGPQRMNTHWATSLFNVRGHVGGLIGMSADAIGGLTRSLSVVAAGISHRDESKRAQAFQDFYTTKAANSMSNFGSYVTHQNQDEQLGAFETGASFGYNFHAGLGQLASMILVGRIARDKLGMGLNASAQTSIAFGSAQRGAAVQNTALLYGATEAEAASMLYIYGSVTYMANMIFRANTLQKIGLKRATDIERKHIHGYLSAQTKQYNNIPIANLSPKTQEAIGYGMAKGGVSKLLKYRSKVDDVLTKMSEKRLFGVPIGTNITSAAEEFLEEGTEELVDSKLLNPIYNKYFAVPRAREIEKEYSKYEYNIDYDANDRPIYYKTDRSGKRVVMGYSVWQKEQEDLSKAQSVLDGNYYFDEEFDWDEPLMGAIVGGFGATPAYFIGGAHKARRDNDQKHFRQKLALEIAQSKGKKREQLLEDVKTQMRNYQKTTGAFGADHLTPDGQIINPETQATENMISASEHEISMFMQDLELDIQNIDAFGLNTVETINATRKDTSLAMEALEVIGNIKALQNVLNELETNNAYSIPDSLASILEEGMSKEQITALLEKEQKAYSDITQPSDGLGGKLKSKRYQEVHGLSLFYGYKEDATARQNVNKSFEEKGKTIDENSNEYKNAVIKEIEKIRNNPSMQFLVALTDSPGNLKGAIDHVAQHGKTNIYQILEHYHHKYFDAEMNVLLKNINEKVKTAQEQAGNLEAVQERVSEALKKVKAFNVSRYNQDTISDALTDELSEISTVIDSITSELSSIRTAGEYSNLQDKRQMYENMFNEVSEAIQSKIDDVSNVLDYEINQTMAMGGDVAGYAPSESIVPLLSRIQKTGQDALSQTPASFKHGDIYENISDAPTEIQSELRQQAAINIVTGLESVGTDTPNTISLIQHLNDTLEHVKNNGVISDVGHIMSIVDNLEFRATLMRELLDINTNFIPTLTGENAQYSIIKDNPYLQYTKKEAAVVEKQIQDALKVIEEIKTNDKIKEFNRERDQVRHKTVNLKSRIFVLQEIQATNQSDKTFGPDYGLAMEALNKKLDPDKKNIGQEALDPLFNKYQETVEGDINKEQVKKTLNEIEKLVLDVEETLGGKLDSYIKQVRDEDANLGHYTDLNEYQEEILVRSGNGLEGALTPEHMMGLYAKNKRDKKFFALTYANHINRFGKKRTDNEKNPTYKELLDAFRQVQENRRETITEEGEAYSTIKDEFNVTTYEQEQLAMHVLGFMIDPSSNEILHGSEFYNTAKKIIKDSIYVRGYGGSGKTTQMIIDVIETYKLIAKDNDLSIAVVVPTSHLQVTHKDNFEVIKQDNVTYYYTHQINDNSTNIKEDIVIVDEASVWSHDMIEGAMEKFAGKTSIWIGDDAQTPPTKSRTFIELPIYGYASERTVPITEVFRSGNTDHHKLQQYFRNVNGGKIADNMPTMKYEYSNNLLVGGRYYANKEAMRNEFLNQYETIPVDKRGSHNIIYLLPQLKDKTEFIEWLTKNKGKEFVDDVSENIFTVEYDPSSENFDSCVSGLSSQIVFYEYTTESLDIPNSPNTSLQDQTAPFGRKYFGRYGLTGISRAKMFLGVLGDPKLSEVGKPFIEPVKVLQETKNEQHNNLLNRLDVLTSGLYKQTDDAGGAKPSEPKSVVNTIQFDRNVKISDENKTLIKEGDNYKNFKKKLEEDNKKKEGLLEDNTNSVSHVTDIIMQTGKFTKTDNKYARRNKEEKLKKKIFSNLIRYASDQGNTGNYFSEALQDIENLNKHYKDNNQEQSVIKDPAKYINKSLNTIQLPYTFTTLKDVDFAFVNQGLFHDNVKYKSKEGELKETPMQANPVMIELVGFDQDSKPIINIHDISTNNTNILVNENTGPYTKEKMGMYVAMANANGMTVNQVTIHNYSYNQASLSYTGSNTITDADLIAGYKDVKEYAFLGDEIVNNIDTPLATYEQLLNNKLSVKDNDGIVHKNKYYANDNGVVLVEDITQNISNGERVLEVTYSNNKTGELEQINYDAFINDFKPIRESEKFYYNNRFKHRSVMYSDHGVFHSHSLVPPPQLVVDNNNIDNILKTKEYKARNNFIHSLNREGRKKIINKSYQTTFNGYAYNPDTGSLSPQTFSHVIVNTLNDGYINENIDNIKAMLSEAGIEIEGKSNAQIIATFKENNFHIISIDSVPEFRFRTSKIDKENSLIGNSLFDDYMQSRKNSQEEVNAINSIKKLMREGFVDENSNPDINQDILIDYNIAQLKAIKHLREVVSVEARFSEVEPGNVITSNNNSKISGDVLKQQLQDKGFTITKNPTQKIDESGKVYYEAEFSRTGNVMSIPVKMEARIATVEDVNSYLDSLKDLVEDETIKNVVNEIERLTDTDKQLTNSEIKKLKEAAGKGFALLENTMAYQFLKANKSLLSKLNEVNLNREGLSFGTVIKSSEYGIEVTGKNLNDRFTNLQSAVKAVRHAITEQGLTLRVDAYSDRADIDIKTDAKADVDLSNLETNVIDIKTPDVYLHSESLNKEISNKNKNENKIEDLPSDETTVDDATTQISERSNSRGRRRKSIDKKRIGVVDTENMVSQEQAISDINNIIGEVNRKNNVKLLDFEAVSEVGNPLYGLLMDNVIQISGYKIDGVTKVNRYAPRHESLHFVMKYLLDSKSHDRVVSDIINELGERYDGTMRQVYEYAADNFERMSGIKKPQNLLQRFVQALKELGNRFSLYRFSYNEFMVAADRGFYRNAHAYSTPNVTENAFEKRKSVSRYGEPQAIKNAIERLNGYPNYSTLKETTVMPIMKSYTGFGKEAGKHITMLDEAIYSIVQHFKNERNLVADNIVETQKGQKKVSELTPDDYNYLLDKNKEEALWDYDYYQLGDREVILTILAELMPNTKVESLLSRYNDRLKNPKKYTNKKSFKGKALNIHSDAEGQKASDRIPDVLNFALSTVKNYDVENGKLGLNEYSTFVPIGYVKKVFTDAVQRLSKRMPIDNITPELLMKEMSVLKHDSTDPLLLKAITNIEIEFGYADYRDFVNGKSVNSYLDNTLEGVGYMTLLENPSKFNDSKTKFDDPQRIKDINNLLSAVTNHFKSIEIHRSGIVDAETGTVESKTSMPLAIEKSRLKGMINTSVLSEGAVIESVGKRFDKKSDEFVVEVTPKHINVIKDGTNTKETNSIFGPSNSSGLSDPTISDLNKLLDILGIRNYSNKTLKAILRNKNRKEQNIYLKALHEMLMATKVNYDFAKLYKEEVETIEGYIEGNKTNVEPYSIKEAVLRKMSPQTNAMYQTLGERYYGFKRRAKTKQETIYHYKPSENHNTEYANKWEQFTETMSPLDLFQNLEVFAKIAAQATMNEVQNVKTAEGETRYVQNPSSTSNRYTHGSDVISTTLKSDLEISNKEKQPLLRPDGGYNSPVLNNLIGFDESLEFTGSKNKWKGRNYPNLTAKDVYISIVETFFGTEVLKNRGWQRINVLLSPFSDKAKAMVLPTYFLKPGGKETISPISIKRNKGRIVDVEVNESLFVDGFDDIVNYYRKRNEVSINEITKHLAGQKVMIGGKQKKLNAKTISELASNNTTIVLNKDQHTIVKRELTKDQDYFIKPNADGTFTFRFGNAATLGTTIFDNNFISKWDKSNSVDRYSMLKLATFNDYNKLIKEMDQVGALDHLRGSKHLEQNRVNILDNFGHKMTDTEGNEITLDQMGQKERQEIKELQSKWFADNGYSYNSTSELYSNLSPKDAREIYNQMKYDGDYRKQRAEINKKYSTLKNKFDKDALNNMTEQSSIPALEALYMTYFLTNESLAHMGRGDITTFANPSQYIKRGAGMNAPGTTFDTSNPNGVGETGRVLVLSDMPGKNEFLGVSDPQSKKGSQMFTDGESTLNSVWHRLLKNSAGDNFGLIGDYANKTVVYGYDAIHARNIYFKMSQSPIDAYQYKNSKYMKDMFHKMLGHEIIQAEWNRIYEETGGDFDTSVEHMADYVVNENNKIVTDEFPAGALPRDLMISYAVYESSFKQGVTGVNQLEFSDPNNMSAENAMMPQGKLKTLAVPNSFMKLQVVNNGDGTSNLHSFATQLYSIIGVKEHNAGVKQDYDNALNHNIQQFINKFNEISQVEAESVEVRNKKILDYVKEVVYENSSHSIRGSKMEKLLRNENTVGEVFGDKLFQAIISELNGHLKPNVPGSNYVQLSAKMGFDDNGSGVLRSAQDLSLIDDSAIPGKRLLRPLSYMNRNSKGVYSSREAMNADVKNNPNDVVAIPAEVIMKFPYAKQFNIGDTETLHQVMTLMNGETLYESAQQRALGEGASNVQEMAEILHSKINPKTGQDLINAFQEGAPRQRVELIIKHAIRKQLNKIVEQRKAEGSEPLTPAQKKEFVKNGLDKAKSDNIVFDSGTAVSLDNPLTLVAEYFYDLNNALDVLSVRIPTTNASSAQTGRIVAFADIGNTIFTSAEKSILDGSDYDHDELHVFYPALEGRKRRKSMDADRTDKQNQNLMFDAMHDFYSDVRNNDLILTPIELDSFRKFADESDGESSPTLANTITHNVYSSDVNFAGKNLVGHFANQMIFTTRLISNSISELEAIVDKSLGMALDPEQYAGTIDLISKLVNAAVDNANENGLLGRLNINQAVTPVIAGMVLSKLSENNLLNTLADDSLKKAAAEVIKSYSVQNLRGKKNIWEVLKDEELLDYAYAGEQLLRLGTFYKITQSMPGTKAEYARTIYNMEKILGMPINEFIQPSNIEKYSLLDYRNEANVRQDIENDIKHLEAEHMYDTDKKQKELKHERAIRSKINIKRIIAKNPLMLNQLRALSAFNEITSTLYFSDNNKDIRNNLLKNIGKPEFLFDESYNDYENSVKKHLIGEYYKLNGSKLNIAYKKSGVETKRVYDLKNTRDQIDFIADFSDYVSDLKRKHPENEFLQRVEFESFGTNPIPVAGMRNSIYMDSSEKAFYSDQFYFLSEDNPTAADAFRNYQLLTYGFSFRNGTFAEVIDVKMDVEFSKEYNNVSKNLRKKHDNNQSNFIRSLAINGDNVLETTSGNLKPTNPNMISKANQYGDKSIFVKTQEGEREGLNMGEEGYALANRIYPKELFVLDPDKGFTFDFKYDKLSLSEMKELQQNGSIQKNTSNWVGVKKNESDPLYANKTPHDGARVLTPMGHVADISLISTNKASLKLVKDKNNPLQSKITRKGSIVSEKGLESLMNVFKRSFKGVNVSYVDNSTSLTNGIAYYQNGTVFINTDKVQVDTPLHELTHPLLHVMKEVRSGQYNALREDAISMIENKDPLALMVKNSYPELSTNDLIDEIISTYVGWTSESKVADYLALQHNANYKQEAKSLWGKLKHKINNFWDSIKSLFGSYNIGVDPKVATIKDFANDIVTKAMSGENILSMSNHDLMNLTRAAYDNMYEQKSPAKDSLELYDRLMNTGKIKEGDLFKEVKQYRHFSEQEKIQKIRNTLDKNKSNTYKLRSGKIVEFDPKKKENWNEKIKQEILPELDDASLSIKNKMLDIINRKDPENMIQNIQEVFGKDEYDKYFFSETEAKRFLNQIRWSPANDYVLYSQLENHKKYGHLFNERLKGFDPIVSIEHDSQDGLILSVYNITTENVRKRDELAPLERKNILNEYIGDGRAKRKGITLVNNYGDVSNLMMSLTASNMVKSNPKTMINIMGTISINPAKSKMVLVDGAEMKHNIEYMLREERFMQDVSPEMKKEMESFLLIDDGFDFESILANKYSTAGNAMWDYLDAYQNRGAENLMDRKRMLARRLKDLLSQERQSSSNMNEIELIINSISVMETGGNISEQMNTKSDLNWIKNNISPQFDVGHQMLDIIRRSVLAVSQDNVKEMRQFKRKTNDIWEFFANRYNSNPDNMLGSAAPFVKDVTHQYYNDIIARVKDTEGNMRNAGHILWTTDSKLDPMFSDQAKALLNKIEGTKALEMGSRIVDQITEIMVQAYKADRIKKIGPRVKIDGKWQVYTDQMAEIDMFKNTSYKKGMLPLMPDTVGQLLSKGKLIDAIKMKQKQIESAYVSFEDISDLSGHDSNMLDSIPDIFLGQFANKNASTMGSLGTEYRMRTYLGITETVDGGYYYDAQTSRNENLNTDLETLVEFFKMSTMRKNKYEATVLPLINGVKTYMNDLQTNMDFKQENALKYLNLYVNQAVFNRRQKESMPVAGIELSQLANTAMSYGSPLVMTLNVNVGAVSTIHNGMMAWIEGLTNDIYNALNPTEQRHWFGAKHLTQGSAVYFSDWSKTMEMMREFQILNPNEYELITHRFNQKRKKHIMSDYYAQWTNWAADAYARGVVMNAQMIKDGSYGAHTLDKETGLMKYDPRKDERFKILFEANADKSSAAYKKAEVLYQALKDRLVSEGYELNNGEASRGYSNNETRAFKGFADKYITGAYGPMEKNMLSQFLIGRMAMMFTTWFMTKASMAIKQGSYLDEVGYFDIKEDSNGNFVAHWQREWTEGYLTTVVRMMVDLARYGDTKQFKNMTPAEKYNWTKYGMTVGTFLSSYLLYALAVAKRGSEDEKGIPEWRLTRNFRYAYGSLMVLPTIYEKLVSPFAVVGIMQRALRSGMSLIDINTYHNLKYVLPGAGGAMTIAEPIQDIFGND